jgi:hypothetical protein
MTTETAKKTAEIRANMPFLVRAEGVWEGWYRYYDAATGQLVDQHRSRLICRLPDEGPHAGVYHQTNYYFWEDGRSETRDFPAWYENGRIWWDNEHITGWAAAMKPDDFNRTTCLNWTRKGEPDLYLYEMIQVSADNQHRARTWQWFRKDVCFQRTLIDERFITADWRSFTDDGAPKN